MQILLDTHILIWAQLEPMKLSPRARDLLIDPNNEILFSAASIWEIAIKAQLGRTNFRARPDQIAKAALSDDFIELPVDSDVAASVVDLPLLHFDPFDRLLIAQAKHLPARLLTVDKKLVPYSDLVMLV
jgi:PIN domain nuclease of toxin-antitoxin system